MNKLFGNDDREIMSYVQNLLKVEDDILKEVRNESKKEGLPDIHVSDLDGRHLELLASMVGAKKVVEIGTLGGYSSICLLRGVGSTGHLYTFEFNPRHAQVAHRNFKMARLDHQVTQFVGLAIENLPQIEKDGPFDLVFIDADKGGYPDYLSWAEKNLRVGGVVIGDNTFAFGNIAKSFSGEEMKTSVHALREFNRKLADSSHFCTTIFPTGEGLTVAVKIR